MSSILYCCINSLLGKIGEICSVSGGGVCVCNFCYFHSFSIFSYSFRVNTFSMISSTRASLTNLTM